MKTKIIAAFLILSVIFAWQWKVQHDKFLNEKEARVRLENNQKQLLRSDSLKFIKLTLTFEEFKYSMTRKIDSLLKAEQIKPRQIQKIVERHYYYRDTSYNRIAPEPVNANQGEIFPFTDIKDCFRVDGYMQIKDLRPILIITNREFKNNTTDILYLERSKKFLFIKFGKLRAQLRSIPECGTESIKEVEIIKKNSGL